MYKTSSACLSLAQTCQKICWVNWGWTFDGVRIGLTHAGRVAPSRWAATQRSETAPHGCLVAAFCTFWLCDSDLWPYDLILIGGRGIVIDYPCAKFGDFSFSRFGFIVQTDRQAESQMRMIAILTRLPSAWVISKTWQFTHCRPNYNYHYRRPLRHRCHWPPNGFWCIISIILTENG